MARLYRRLKWVSIAPEIVAGHRIRLHHITEVRSLITAVRKSGFNAKYRTESHRGLISYIVEGT